MLLKPFSQYLTEIKLNTAVRAYRKMDDIANDWEASKEDTKRANRFRNRIKSKFGEKGAALADKISSPESKAIRDKRETNRYGHDSLKHRVLNPLNKTPLKSGPRKGKLTKPTQDLLKAQSVYQRKDINKVKPKLPESFKLSFAQYITEERDQDKDGHAISDAWIKKYGHRGQTSLGHEAILPPGKFFASLITKARLVWPDKTFRYGHPSQTNSYEFRTHPTKPGLVAVVGHVWWANHWPSGWYTRAAAAELYKALKADGMVEDKT